MPSWGSSEFDFAFVNAFLGGDVEQILVEVAVIDSSVFISGLRQHELDAPWLVKDLETCLSAYQEMPISGAALSIECAVFVSRCALSVEVGLAVGHTSISKDLKGVRKGIIKLANNELSLICAQADPIGMIKAKLVLGFPIKRELVNHAIRGARKEHMALVRDDNVVCFGFAFQGFEVSTFEVVLADFETGCVEFCSIRPEGDSIGSCGIFCK